MENNLTKEKIEALDLNFTEKLISITNTLDTFLKRMAGIKTEMMKADINRVKKVLLEKLGVEL